MDDKKLEHFRNKIYEEIHRLRGGLSNLSDDFEGVIDSKSAEFEETARLERDRDILSSILSIDSEEMNELEEALKRLRDGTYGICVDCGNEIPEARLEARPTTVRCIDCQASLESGQRRG